VGRFGALGPLGAIPLGSGPVADTETATELAPARADELHREGAKLIDVRTPHEHEAGHIPGDELIAFNELKDRADELPRDAPVIAYCRSGDRSGAAVQALRASGYDAYSVEGGIVAWSAQGLAIEPADGQIVEPPGLPPD
jgi:rhodanese-related sulfurtransferase